MPCCPYFAPFLGMLHRRIDGRDFDIEQQCPKIEAALQHLLATVRPKLVYLYKHRISDQGETVGFKFCVVTHVADPVELERRLY